MKTEGDWTIAEGTEDIVALGQAQKDDEIQDRTFQGVNAPWRKVQHHSHYNQSFNGRIRRRTRWMQATTSEAEHFIL